MSSFPAFDILGFGAVAVDDLLYVDSYPAAETKVRVRTRIRQCGGLTGTALVAAARLGSRCAYVGRLGNDELSQFVKQSFAKEGINLDHYARCTDAPPAHSTIIVDEGRNTRTIFASVGGAIGADDRSPEPELIRNARALLVDHHGLEGTIRAAQIAKENAVSVVADFERDPGEPFGELLAAVDHLIISQQFARRLTGLDDPARSAEKLFGGGGRAVVITCGAAGCWFLDETTRGKPVHRRAFEVAVVDTTGCGDVFHGAYAAALARGINLPERIRIAAAAAALKAMRRGGQAGCPSRPELDEFLRERGS